MPADGVPLRPHAEILRYEELERLAGLAAGLGFRHFRITGGEPLARRGSAEFVARLGDRLRRAGPGSDLSLTTNGTLFGPVASGLRRAGLRRVNISLDTLDRAKFHHLTRRDLWPAAWEGVEAALREGYDPVKLNFVLMRGVNDDEIAAFGRLTQDLPLHVRFIELMPLGEGCAMGGEFMSADEAAALLSAVGPLEPLEEAGDVALAPSISGHAPRGAGPADCYRLPGARGTVGFIAALSHAFCGGCNRLRLTADGKLHPCLASDLEFDLRGPLRAGAGDEELAAVFRAAVAAKPAQHGMGREAAAAGLTAKRRMSRIGG